MERIHIFIAKFIDNFTVVSQGHELIVDGKPVEVYFHNEYNYAIVDSKAKVNVDYAIVDTISEETENLEVILGDRLLWSPRTSKSRQILLLSKYLQENPNKDFLIPSTHDAKCLTRNNKAAGHLEGEIVVKPEFSARGVGQIKLTLGNPDDFREGKTLNKSGINRLVSLLTKLSEGDISTEDFKSKLMEEFPDAIISTKGEKYQDEGIEFLKGRPYIVQKVVPNVVKEYRVLVDYHNEIVYLQDRSIVDVGSGYRQAIGSNEVNHSSFQDTLADIVSRIGLGNYMYLQDLIKSIVHRGNSLDLFITEDNKFGIFEWSNQFGTLGIPSKFNLEFHEKFLTDFLNNSK